jgi:hypothetical protein
LVNRKAMVSSWRSSFHIETIDIDSSIEEWKEELSVLAVDWVLVRSTLTTFSSMIIVIVPCTQTVS